MYKRQESSTIQAQLPNRLSIKTVNELLQAIESIFLPQSPDAIARRQSLFHKLTQGEGETTSALFNRILLYFRMFEYSLRTKDLIDLIGCMYMTFKNRSLFVQTRDKCLSAAKNGRLDIQAISRNIVETESAMRDLGQTHSYFLHIRTGRHVTYVIYRDISPRDARTGAQLDWKVSILQQ